MRRLESTGGRKPSAEHCPFGQKGNRLGTGTPMNVPQCLSKILYDRGAEPSAGHMARRDQVRVSSLERALPRSPHAVAMQPAAVPSLQLQRSLAHQSEALGPATEPARPSPARSGRAQNGG